MKPRAVILAAVAAHGASAQVGYGGGGPITTTTTTTTSTSSSSSSSSSVAISPAAVTSSPSASASYVTVTYDDCPSSSVATMITVTAGMTVTYCPECQMPSSSSPVMGHTTVYTTTYQSLCPTGLVPATYTITESCTAATPTWGATSSGYIPPGFTVTVKNCTVCGATPTPVTITEKCGCEATNGVPVTQPMATPTGSSPSGGSGSGSPPSGGSGSGSPPSGGSGSSSPPSGASSSAAAPSGSAISQISDGQIQAPGPATSAAPGGSASNGGAAPYPTTAATATVCPGPQCRAVESGAPTGVTYGNTTGITPYAGGAATSSHIGIFTASLAALVAALAFML